MPEGLEPIGWFNILTLSLTIMFGMLAIIFFFKSIRVRAPRYAIHNFNVLELRVGDMPLKMLYADQEIERLTATKIAFWNAGRETINSQDVAEPITVQVKDRCKILNARILHVKNPVNNFHIPSYTQTNVPLCFDYVDKDEGAVIQILHTGKSSEDLDFRGTIKAAGKPTCVIAPVIRLRRALAFPTFSFLFAIIMAIAIVYQNLLYRTPESEVLTLIIVVMVVLMAITYFALVSRVLRSKVPKGFGVFSEEF